MAYMVIIYIYIYIFFFFFEELSYCFPWKWQDFKFLQTGHNGSRFFTSLLIFVIFCFFFFFFDSRYPNEYEVVSHVVLTCIS